TQTASSRGVIRLTAMVGSGGLCRRARLGEELADPSDRLADVLRRVGVGEAEIGLAENAEIGAAGGGDPGLLEGLPGGRLCLQAGPGDVWESVEGALRRDARDAGELVQFLDHDLPPLVELGDHLADRVLRAGERGETGKLRRCIHAGPGVD